MRIFSVLAAALLFGTVTVVGQTAAPLRWAEGAPNATSEMKDNSKIEGLKTDDAHVFVSLSDLKDTEYNRVWIQITNHSKAPIDFDPQAAMLVNEKDKTVRAEVPDKGSQLHSEVR